MGNFLTQCFYLMSCQHLSVVASLCCRPASSAHGLRCDAVSSLLLAGCSALFANTLCPC